MIDRFGVVEPRCKRLGADFKTQPIRLHKTIPAAIEICQVGERVAAVICLHVGDWGPVYLKRAKSLVVLELRIPSANGSLQQALAKILNSQLDILARVAQRGGANRAQP